MKPSVIMHGFLIAGLTSFVSFATASTTSFDARNSAMGNTGAASSHIGAAPLVNPALLAKKQANYAITLVAPSLGAQVSDAGNLINNFEDVKTVWDNLERALPSGNVATEAAEFKDVINGIAGHNANANLSMAMVLAVPNETLPVALFISTWAKGIAQALVTQSDLDFMEQVADGSLIPAPDALDNLTSRAEGMVALVTEYGVALAKPFTFGDIPMGIGFTPKIQRVETWNYNVAINNYDTKELREGNITRQTMTANFDAGIYADLQPNWTVALSAQNLIEQRIKSKESNGLQNEFVMRPQVTAATAWSHGPITLSSDIDLSPTSHFATVDKRQYAAIGAELSATDWAQLRMGYRVDMRGNDHRMFTAGFGLKPMENVQFDLAAMAGRMRTIGGVAQLSYNF